MQDTKYLTTQEYADIFSMHPQVVRDKCKSGVIPAQKIGRSWRIPYIPPPNLDAEQEVQRMVDAMVRPCLAVVDATLDALQEIKAELSRRLS